MNRHRIQGLAGRLDVTFVRKVVTSLDDGQVHVALVELAAVANLTAAEERLAGNLVGRSLAAGVRGIVGGEETVVPPFPVIVIGAGDGLTIDGVRVRDRI